MGKKKRLQAEIDRLNAQKPSKEITSYKNLDQTPRTSVAAVLGSAMTGYKTSSGPSMYGTAYNYKNITSCGPSMEGGKTRRGLNRQLKAEEKGFDNIADYKGAMKEGRQVNRANRKQERKEDNEGKTESALKKMEGAPGGMGKRDMLSTALISAAESGLTQVVSHLSAKKAAKIQKQSNFRNQFSSNRSGGGGSGYSSTRQPSYAELMNKYQSK
tara:strand:- start:188 stop:829 length:642 start_codon:yes stop_codon:yes gene_type:complete